MAFLIVLGPSSAIFFFNDTATTEIYTLSLHDALPISSTWSNGTAMSSNGSHTKPSSGSMEDRKSTRLNSSHLVISYAVFCLKKKNTAAPRPGPRCPDSPRVQADLGATPVNL